LLNACSGDSAFATVAPSTAITIRERTLCVIAASTANARASAAPRKAIAQCSLPTRQCDFLETVPFGYRKRANGKPRKPPSLESTWRLLPLPPTRPQVALCRLNRTGKCRRRRRAVRNVPNPERSQPGTRSLKRGGLVRERCTFTGLTPPCGRDPYRFRPCTGKRRADGDRAT
jgi:hypothetical protein